MSKITCTWDEVGQIRQSVHGGYPSNQEDLAFIIAPSFPMLLSHQLGTLRPSHALILSSNVIDLLKGASHIRRPVNSALKAASIEFAESRSGTTMQFHPHHGLFANNDSLEEGVRQFIHNYSAHILAKLTGETYLIVRGMAGSVIDQYLELVEHELASGRIGPSWDKWNPSFSANMAVTTGSMANMYGPTFPPGTDLHEVDATFYREIPHIEERLAAATTAMGMSV